MNGGDQRGVSRIADNRTQGCVFAEASGQDPGSNFVCLNSFTFLKGSSEFLAFEEVGRKLLICGSQEPRRGTLDLASSCSFGDKFVRAWGSRVCCQGFSCWSDKLTSAPFGEEM